MLPLRFVVPAPSKVKVTLAAEFTTPRLKPPGKGQGSRRERICDASVSRHVRRSAEFEVVASGESHGPTENGYVGNRLRTTQVGIGGDAGPGESYRARAERRSIPEDHGSCREGSGTRVGVGSADDPVTGIGFREAQSPRCSSVADHAGNCVGSGVRAPQSQGEAVAEEVVPTLVPPAMTSELVASVELFWNV